MPVQKGFSGMGVSPHSQRVRQPCPSLISVRPFPCAGYPLLDGFHVAVAQQMPYFHLILEAGVALNRIRLAAVQVRATLLTPMFDRQHGDTEVIRSIPRRYPVRMAMSGIAIVNQFFLSLTARP